MVSPKCASASELAPKIKLRLCSRVCSVEESQSYSAQQQNPQVGTKTMASGLHSLIPSPLSVQHFNWKIIQMSRTVLSLQGYVQNKAIFAMENITKNIACKQN